MPLRLERTERPKNPPTYAGNEGVLLYQIGKLKIGKKRSHHVYHKVLMLSFHCLFFLVKYHLIGIV